MKFVAALKPRVGMVADYSKWTSVLFDCTIRSGVSMTRTAG